MMPNEFEVNVDYNSDSTQNCTFWWKMGIRYVCVSPASTITGANVFSPQRAHTIRWNIPMVLR